jgi:hypothetical protein
VPEGIGSEQPMGFDLVGELLLEASVAEQHPETAEQSSRWSHQVMMAIYAIGQRTSTPIDG